MIFHKSHETGILTYVAEVQVREPVMMLNGFCRIPVRKEELSLCMRAKTLSLLIFL
jgi:hypothetical protein